MITTLVAVALMQADPSPAQLFEVVRERSTVHHRVVAAALDPVESAEEPQREVAEYAGLKVDPTVKGDGGYVLDIKNGFRDIHFGDDLTKVAGMKLMSRSRDGDTFERSTDAMRLGDVPLARVFYTAHKGRLVSVALLFSGMSNAEAGRRTFAAAYGKGIKPNPYIETYRWDALLVRASYSEDAVREVGIITITNKAMLRELLHEREMNARAAASDL